MFNFNKAKVIIAMFLALIAINSCKKENVVPNETDLTKQQKSTNFVIVTEEERQYMGEPMSIDNFIDCVPSFIKMATVKMGCYFVVYVNDDMVRNAVLGKKTSYTVWYNRLHEYFEVARMNINPDASLIKSSRYTTYPEELNKWVNECINNKISFCVDYDEENKIWYICTNV